MLGIKKEQMDMVVTIYSDAIEDDYVIGKIMSCNKSEMIVACIDKSGESDGVIWIKLDSVYRMDYGSAFEKKIESLYQIKKQNHNVDGLNVDVRVLKNAILTWAYKANKIVTLQFYDDDYEVAGYIKHLNPFEIKVIDKYECKNAQGYACLDIEKVKCIFVDDKRARDAELVYQYRSLCEEEEENE